MFNEITNPLNQGVVNYSDDFTSDESKDYGLRLVVKIDDDYFFVVKYYKLDESIRGSCANRVKSVKFWSKMDFDSYIEHNGPISEEKETTDLSLIEYVTTMYNDDIEAATEMGTKIPDETDNIVMHTKTFFNIMDLSKQKFVYDSCYTSDDNPDVDRMAFTTGSAQNAVIKTWNNSLTNKFSLKFEDALISEMAEEWNMHKSTLVDEDYDVLLSLKDELQVQLITSALVMDQMLLREQEMGIERDPNQKLNQEDILPPKATAQPWVQGKRKDRIFNFKEVDIKLFIINDRAVVVFLLTYNDNYIIWDVTGGEDHRISVSAKGPFDDTLEVLPGKPWNLFYYQQEEFLEKIGMEKERLVRLFANYSTNWMLNTKEIHITTIRQPGGS